MESFELERLLRQCLQEDIGTGDITSESCVPAAARAKGVLTAKEPGVICGIEVVRRVFEIVSPEIELSVQIEDGESASAGDTIGTLTGPARGILTGERVALNFLQRLSGIATRTRACVCQVAGTGAAVVDTRKTTPGLRVLEKYAVRMGGGSNHRFGLSDGVLIKDNHIVAAGGITSAVRAARERAPHTIKIEVEVESVDQALEAVAAGADIIMLDNMEPEMMTAAVAAIDGRALTEASGNMDRRDLRQVALTGVNLISIGALTHTVKAMDISLRFL